MLTTIASYGLILLAALASFNTPAAPSWAKIGSGTSASCPAGYIPISAYALPSTTPVPAFCVMKYEAKKNNTAVGDRSVGGAMGTYPVSTSANLPWTALTWQEARSACAAAGAHLISENQWLSIAHQITGVDSNWTLGVRGSGTLYMGHSDNVPAASLAASALDTDGWSGTGQTSGAQRRTYTLPNGQVLWDLSGNLYEYVDLTMLVADRYHPGTASYYDYNIAIGTSPLATNIPLDKRPPNNYNANQGAGRYYAGSTIQKSEMSVNEAPDFCNGVCGYTAVFMRGGGFNGGTAVGPFSLYLYIGRSNTGGSFYGFRCTR